MTAAPKIDVRDLNSVRRAAHEGGRETREGVVLGEDWVSPETSDQPRRRPRLVRLNRSPLARKIITFNLIALLLLVAGMLYLTPSRDNLAFQRASSLVSQAELVADLFEVQLPGTAPVDLMTGDGIDVAMGRRLVRNWRQERASGCTGGSR